MHSIVVIGAGSIGQHHIRVANCHPLFNLVGVVEPATGTYDAFSAENKFPILKNTQDALNEVNFNSAILACPTRFHFEIAKRLLENRVNLLVEKPFTGNLDQAKILKQIAEGNNVKCSVGYTERYNSLVIELKKIIADKTFGELQKINICRTSVINGSHPPTEDVVSDLAVHDFDFIYSACGNFEILNMKAVLSDGYNIPVDAAIELETNSSTRAHIHVMWITDVNKRSRIYDLYFDHAKIHANLLTNELCIQTQADSQQDHIIENPYGSSQIFHQSREPLSLQLDEFAKLLAGAENTLATVDESIYNLDKISQVLCKLRS